MAGLLQVKPTTLMAGGSVFSAMGDIYSGYKAKKTAEMNAAMAEAEAEYAKKKSRLDAKALQQVFNQRVGSAVAIAGASGFAVESPSTQDVISDLIHAGQLDIAMVRLEGDIGSWKGKATASLLESEGDKFMTAGFMGATNTLLSGASKMSKYTDKKVVPEEPETMKA